MLRKSIEGAAQNRLLESTALPRWKRIALTCLLGGALACLPVRGHAAGLDCPEIGPPGAVSSLLSDVQVKLVATGNSVDLANETYDLINRKKETSKHFSKQKRTTRLLRSRIS
jgi:hypothetical protein